MSIQQEVDRIKARVAESYAAVSEKGGSLPDTKVIENLPDAIRTVKDGEYDWWSPRMLSNDDAMEPTLALPKLQEKSIELTDPEQTITPDTGYDGLSKVTVSKGSGGSGSGNTGGGNGAAPLDPVEVYNNTRPKDWFQMPMPNEDELYLLVNVPKDGSALLAFTVTCTGNYTVTTYGCVSTTEIVVLDEVSLTSNGKFEGMFIGNNLIDCQVTSDGMRQVLVKIEGNAITKWTLATHSKKTSPSSYMSWNIVEIVGKLPSATALSCDKLYQLRYFTLYGKNGIVNMNTMFNKCRSLVSILELDTSNVTNMNNTFYCCYSLTSIPELDTSNVTILYGMFTSCRALTSVPELDTSKATNMGFMFYDCRSLVSIPELDTSNVTNMSNMFYNAYSLTSVPKLNTSKVTSMNSMFRSCSALTLLPELDMSSVTDATYMFYECNSLTSIPKLNTSNITNANNMFCDCTALTSIPKLDMSKATNMGYMLNGCESLVYISGLRLLKNANTNYTFSNCAALSSIKLDPTVEGWGGVEIDIMNCSLLREGIIELFESLPTITSSKQIIIIGNPGYNDLTAEDKAIATSKGWSIV